MANEADVVAEQLENRSFPNRKNPGKAPKKIHKAKREKLKRDYLNELFLELGHALEPSRQNNGKASTVGDATRILRDLLLQVEHLKEENVALLTESHYVSVEKDELREETTVLEAEIEKLQTQLHERIQSGPTWSNSNDLSSSLLQQTNTASSLSEDHHSLPVLDPAGPVLQQQPILAPVYVIPLRHELSSQAPPRPPSNVSRPLPRYPTPSDSWPSQLLNKTPMTSPQVSSSISITNSREEGAGDVEVSRGLICSGQ